SAAISKVFFEPVYPTTQTKVDLEELERGWRPKEGLEKRVKYYMQQKPESENPQYQQIEAIPEGTELATSITGVGLREYEIGGLLMSIGINASESGALSSMPVKIGYGKPQGFGQMAAQTNTLAIIQHVQSILSFTPENITSDAARMVKAFKQRVRQNAPWKPVDSDYQKLFSWRD
nr:hypothetical protein [Candidatus Sigynarchaeota archaeon]